MHYNTMGNDASSQSYPFQQHFNEEAVDSGEGCELAWQRSGCRSVSGTNLSYICAGTYPPGSSKWNPIEHRLFSEITKNWRGRPLDSYETVLNHLRTTKTKTGLAVSACLLEGNYPLKLKVSKEDKAALNIQRPDGVMPQWNYVLSPN